MATPSDPRRGPSQVRPALPRKPAGTVLQQRAFAALMLAIISLLWVPGVSGNLRRGVVVLAVTMVIGAVGRVAWRSPRCPGPGGDPARPRFAVILASVLGIVGTGLSTLALIGFATFWLQISQYANCMSGAITVSHAGSLRPAALNNALQTSMQLLGRLFPGDTHHQSRGTETRDSALTMAILRRSAGYSKTVSLAVRRLFRASLCLNVRFLPGGVP